MRNIKANKARFGSFTQSGIGKLFHRDKNKPVIAVGSGPSLKRNAHELLKNKDITVISCLHNFHFLEDLGVKVDFYVSLDAGDVTVEEVSEGGSKSEDEYWALTKDRTLLAYIGSSPRLLQKWQGQILFFNCMTPDQKLEDEVAAVERFGTYVSSGGNVLGACVYIAKAILGAGAVIFMGADFAFGYDKKFHAWDSKYDREMGQIMRTVDVYGNKVYTWPSYHGFKCFFDNLVEKVPGVFINCTEGGTLGAYPEGNIMSVPQMDLAECLRMYDLSEVIRPSCESPETAPKGVLY